jgi:putative phosphoesterase
MKIGLISDTHGHLDPRVIELFHGVDHILHAGDIGFPSLILELEAIAPVTAVLGNNDDTRFEFRDLEVVQLGGRKFLLHHIIDPETPTDRLQLAYLHESPDIVVFGHTHRRHHSMVGPRLFLNPGYSGKPRHGTERSVAVVEIDGDVVTTDFHNLD